MIYRTTDRFASPSTITQDDIEPTNIEVTPYKTDTVLTNENLARPFEQIQDALKLIQVGGENVRN